jgi:hypothetical protein
MDYNKIAAYSLSVCLLGLSVYLKSPLVAVASVLLFAFHYGHEVLLKVQDNKLFEQVQAELVVVKANAAATNARLEDMNKDLAATLVRVRETLGESF